MKTLRKALLLIFALVAFGQISWAQAFITDVVVIGADDDDDADWYYGSYEYFGWIGTSRDLNDGAGGHYIYLMYKTNNSPQNSGTAINDFYLRVSDSPGAPDWLTHLGRTYYRVGADGDSQFISSGGDLNCGAGGYYIHLYYTKEGNSPVRCSSISYTASPYSPCNAVGMNGSTTAADLNLGAGGDDIFMHVYKHLASSPAEIYTEGQPLYFYFLGNKDAGTLTAGTTESCSVNISDQTSNLPVISMAPSTVSYSSSVNSYSAALHNKCAMVKFNVTSASTSPICITGMNNKVTVNFDPTTAETDEGFSFSVDAADGGLIKMAGKNDDGETWAIALPQAAMAAGAEGTAYTNTEEQRYKGSRPALEAITSAWCAMRTENIDD